MYSSILIPCRYILQLATEQKEAWEKAAQYAQASGLAPPIPSSTGTAQATVPTQSPSQGSPAQQLTQSIKPVHTGVK